MAPILGTTTAVPPPLLPADSHAAAAFQQARTAFQSAPSLYPRPSLGARVVAKLIDFVVGWGPALSAWALFQLTVLRALQSAMDGQSAALVIPLFFLAVAAWGVWYTFTKDGNARGAGIGKRAMGLMVVHLERETACNKGQCAIRQAVLQFAYLIPILGWLTEPLAAMLTSGGRRLGDFAAGTQVVRAADWAARRAQQPASAAGTVSARVA